METPSGIRPYVCDVCNKTFAHKGNLKRHELLHTPKQLYSCSLCNRGFTQKNNLNRHFICHTGEKRFACNICNKKFSQKDHLKIHLGRHNGDKRFSCHLCPKKFVTKQNLQDHLLRHHSGRRTYVCAVCNEGYLDVYKYNLHVLGHKTQNGESDTHNQSLRPDTSSQVDENNTYVQYYEDIDSSIAYSDNDDTYLVHCDTTSGVHDTNDSERPEYSKHTIFQSEYSNNDNNENTTPNFRNSNSEDTNKVCVQYCDKECSENTNPCINYYEESKHCEEECSPESPCRDYDDTKTQIVSNSHAKIHDNYDYTKILVVNSDRTEGRFVDCDETEVCHEYYMDTNTCSLCSKTFSNKSNMLRHFQAHISAQTYQCKLCSLKFTHPSNYKRHLLMHSNIKHFWCNFCKKGFTQKSNLERHLAIHKKQSKFVRVKKGELYCKYLCYCEECGEFVTESDWESHKLIHEDEAVILVIA